MLARSSVAKILTVAEECIVARRIVRLMVVQAVPTAVTGIGIRANRVAWIATGRGVQFVIIETRARAVAGVGIGALRVTRISTGAIDS
jgi:hypothetical protein